MKEAKKRIKRIVRLRNVENPRLWITHIDKLIYIALKAEHHSLCIPMKNQVC